MVECRRSPGLDDHDLHSARCCLPRARRPRVESIHSGGRDGTAATVTHVLSVENGLVVSIFLSVDNHEAWLHSSHPDRYSELFEGPCCGSHPVFTGETAQQQADLLDEWEAAAE